MATPTEKELRQSVWDTIRYRLRINISDITSKKQLLDEIRGRLGLNKYQKLTKKYGKDRNFFNLVKKSDFWAKSKYEDRPYFLRSRKGGWLEGEETTLKELSKRYKGKELVAEFNKRVKPGRSYMGVMVRKSKLKK